MLRIIVGRAGVGKSYRVLEDIGEELRRDPAGPPLLLVVPEESTFAMEQAILRHSGLAGIYRAQVLGFRRLRWRILQNSGGMPEPPLSDQGSKLLMAGLLQEHRDELRIFQGVVSRPGFVDKLSRVIMEIEQSHLGALELEGELLTVPVTIAAALDLTDWDEPETMDGERVLEAKAHDLELIWEAYQTKLMGLELADDNECWRKAVEGISRAAFLEGAEVWIDGFNTFSAPEIGLIAALLQKVKRASITLRLDETVSIARDNGVFAYTAATFRSLVELAETLSIPHSVEAISGEGMASSGTSGTPSAASCPPRFRASKELAYLEEQLRYPHGHRIPFPQPTHRVKIVSAANFREEVMQTARFLIGQARDRGVRWRDMAVAASDLDSYAGLLTGIFSECSIPFFLDRPRVVHWHPLIVFLSGVLELVTYDWKTETVMQVLKSDLTPGSRYEVDCLENHVLANGIDGYLWREPGVLAKIRSDLGEDIALDDKLMPLFTFYEKAVAAKETPILGRQLMTALWSLLEEYSIPARLDYWVNQEGSSLLHGSLSQGSSIQSAEEHLGIWSLWVDLVDDFMRSLGNTPLKWEQFASLLQASIDGLRLTRIPQGIDQVLVTTPARLLNSEVEVLAILGADEQHLRVTDREDTIVNDAERLALQEKGWHLELPGRQQMLREPLFWYSLFTRAKDMLYLSYSLADEKGKSLEAATVVKEVQKLFPDLSNGSPSLARDGLGNHKMSLPCTMSDAASLVSRLLRRKRDGFAGEMDGDRENLVLALYDWLIDQDQGRSALQRCLGGFSYTNQAGSLSCSVINRLYDGTLMTNVHHLEAMAQCPFRYFASAVLKLEERSLLQWDALVEGQLWHEALAKLTRHLWRNDLDLADLEELELEAMALQIWQEAALRYAPMYTDVVESYHYRIERLGRGFQRVARVLAEHARRGRFRPVAVEVSFGISQGFPAWQIPLGDHGTVSIRGRIDRIETVREGNTVYFRVIDFKRGARRLQLTDVYLGFSLQLLTYIGAVLANGQLLKGEQQGSSYIQLVPAGALYFPLNEPLVKTEGPVHEETLAGKLLAQYRTSGILLADTEVIEWMESGLSGSSQLLPVGITKQGGFYKSSCVHPWGEMEILLAYVRLSIRSLAEAILDGRIDIAPYRKSRDRACRYCPYLQVCRFEMGVAGCGYRYIPDISAKEALLYMTNAVAQQREAKQRGEVKSNGG